MIRTTELPAFTAFLEAHGYVREQTGSGGWEIARYRHPTAVKPVLIYRRAKGNELTVRTNGTSVLDDFLKGDESW